MRETKESSRRSARFKADRSVSGNVRSFLLALSLHPLSLFNSDRIVATRISFDKTGISLILKIRGICGRVLDRFYCDARNMCLLHILVSLWNCPVLALMLVTRHLIGKIKEMLIRPLLDPFTNYKETLRL